MFSSVQLLSCVQLFETPWTAARQASLSITNSQEALIHSYTFMTRNTFRTSSASVQDISLKSFTPRDVGLRDCGLTSQVWNPQGKLGILEEAEAPIPTQDFFFREASVLLSRSSHWLNPAPLDELGSSPLTEVNQLWTWFPSTRFLHSNSWERLWLNNWRL